jgi:hypothetical protein
MYRFASDYSRIAVILFLFRYHPHFEVTGNGSVISTTSKFGILTAVISFLFLI